VVVAGPQDHIKDATDRMLNEEVVVVAGRTRGRTAADRVLGKEVVVVLAGRWGGGSEVIDTELRELGLYPLGHARDAVGPVLREKVVVAGQQLGAGLLCCQDSFRLDAGDDPSDEVE